MRSTGPSPGAEVPDATAEPARPAAPPPGTGRTGMNVPAQGPPGYERPCDRVVRPPDYPLARLVCAAAAGETGGPSTNVASGCPASTT
jgi:hypothetical protein